MSTLADLAANAKAEHVRALSARALLNIDRPSAEDEEDTRNGEESPKPCVILPANGRELESPPYATREDAERGAASGATGVLVYETPQAAAWRPGHIARLGRMRRRDTEQLALPVPALEVEP